MLFTQRIPTRTAKNFKEKNKVEIKIKANNCDTFLLYICVCGAHCCNIIVSPPFSVTVYNSASQRVVPRPTSLAPENLFEIQILEPHPRLTDSEIWGWVPAICLWTSTPCESAGTFKFGNNWFRSNVTTSIPCLHRTLEEAYLQTVWW